jgi:hypothetical protein
MKYFDERYDFETEILDMDYECEFPSENDIY